MEVYIFDKNRRCPYLNYGFYNPIIKQYVEDNLKLSIINKECKVDIPFLYKWLHDVQQKQPAYLKIEIHNQELSIITQLIIYKRLSLWQNLVLHKTGLKCILLSTNRRNTWNI